MPYKDKNKEKEHSKKYYLENKQKMQQKGKIYRSKPEVKKRIKFCHKEYCQRPENKKKAKEYSKKHYRKNKEKISKRRKELRQKNKEKIKERGKKYYHDNKEKILKRQHKNYQRPEVKQKQKEYHKEYYLRPENKARKKERDKKYRSKPENKARIKEQSRNYHQINKKKRDDNVRRRKKTDKDFAIKSRLRHLLRRTFKYYTKTGKIMVAKKYGIDYKKMIESLKPFPKDISNYHIDHKKPLCSFTFINEDGSTDLEEIKKAFAPENLQWLTAHENIVKGGRY